MPSINCPSCGHDVKVDEPKTSSAPSPSVLQWFRTDPGWSGEASCDEIYANYLRATDGDPVSREKFVSDLAYLGIEQVLDDDTYFLLRS